MLTRCWPMVGRVGDPEAGRRQESGCREDGGRALAILADGGNAIMAGHPGREISQRAGTSRLRDRWRRPRCPAAGDHDRGDRGSG
jgi:hypothetical protein